MANEKKSTVTKTTATSKKQTKDSTKQAPKTQPKQEKKTTKTTNTAKTSSSKSSNKTVFWGINKISMYTIIAVAFLYALSMILALIPVNLKVVSALQNFATAIMIAIVSVLAWKYVRNKEMVWKILYVICLLLVVAGVIVPLVV